MAPMNSSPILSDIFEDCTEEKLEYTTTTISPIPTQGFENVLSIPPPWF